MAELVRKPGADVRCLITVRRYGVPVDPDTLGVPTLYSDGVPQPVSGAWCEIEPLAGLTGLFTLILHTGDATAGDFFADGKIITWRLPITVDGKEVGGWGDDSVRLDSRDGAWLESRLTELQDLIGLYPGPGAFRLRVLVRDAVTNEPIPGARVSAHLVGANSANLWTDENGLAVLALTPFEWAIVIACTGYDSQIVDPYPITTDNELLEIFLTMSVVLPPEPNKATAWTVTRVNGVATEGCKVTRQYVSSLPGMAGNTDSKVPQIMLSGAGGLVMFTNLLPGTRHAFWRENNMEEAVYVDVPESIPGEGLTIQIPDMGG